MSRHAMTHCIVQYKVACSYTHTQTFNTHTQLHHTMYYQHCYIHVHVHDCMINTEVPCSSSAPDNKVAIVGIRLWSIRNVVIVLVKTWSFLRMWQGQPARGEGGGEGRRGGGRGGEREREEGGEKGLIIEEGGERGEGEGREWQLHTTSKYSPYWKGF